MSCPKCHRSALVRTTEQNIDMLSCKNCGWLLVRTVEVEVKKRDEPETERKESPSNIYTCTACEATFKLQLSSRQKKRFVTGLCENCYRKLKRDLSGVKQFLKKPDNTYCKNPEWFRGVNTDSWKKKRI